MDRNKINRRLTGEQSARHRTNKFKYHQKRSKGFASVFLLIIILSVILCSLVMIEASCGYAASSICNNLSAVSGKSVLSEYKNELFERYGLFAFEKDEEYLENRMKFYLKSSLSSKRGLVQLKLSNLSLDFDSYNDWNSELLKQIGLLSLGLNSYILKYFSNNSDTFENTQFKLECEYIICNKSNDEENLNAIENRIYSSRLAMDIAYIYRNEKTLTSLKSVAKLLLPDMAVDTALFVIVSIKADAMAKEETEQIMDGAKLKVFGEDSSELYADYKDYLLAFLFLESQNTKLERMKKLIEGNIINIDNSFFTFEDFRYGFTAEIDFEKKASVGLLGISKRKKNIKMDFYYR